MHIVQVLAALSVGGSQLVAIELCEYLRKLGHQVTVIAADGPLGERVKSCGAQHLDWNIGKKRLSTLKLIKPLRAWLQKHQPDVIHVHSRLPAWVVYQAIKKTSRPPALVTSMHGHYSVNPYSAVMAKGDRVIAVSEHMRRYTLKQYPQTPAEQVVTIHGGASDNDFPYREKPDANWLKNIDRQFPNLKDKAWLMLPGRVTRWKGHLDFLHLLSRLQTKNPSVHGLIIGPYRENSSYYRELKKQIDALNLEQFVSFIGSRDDIGDWYAASQIVYNLSNNPPEAFGRTVLEALKTGTPVLAWDQGGPAEQLAHFYPAGKIPLHDMDRLEEQTLALLLHPHRVPQQSGFSLQASMQKTLTLYQSVAS